MEKKSMEKIHHSLKSYEIDENGVIYSNGKELPFCNRFKYAGREYKIERLIARIFTPNPNNCKKIVFKDGNDQNIKVSNLEWSSYNQDYYNYLKQNGNHTSGKHCRKCKEFKDYSEYDSNPKGNKLNFCKSCLKERRDLKKEEYEKRRRLRRKSNSSRLGTSSSQTRKKSKRYIRKFSVNSGIIPVRRSSEGMLKSIQSVHPKRKVDSLHTSAKDRCIQILKK
jgi:hypothetical protein